jgi:hypothetical protein
LKNSYDNPTDHPIVAEGGLLAMPVQVADPFAALDDLMAVIEALCPEWPERGTFTAMDRLLL